jgi:hypothetical protein
MSTEAPKYPPERKVYGQVGHEREPSLLSKAGKGSMVLSKVYRLVWTDRQVE